VITAMCRHYETLKELRIHCIAARTNPKRVIASGTIEFKRNDLLQVNWLEFAMPDQIPQTEFVLTIKNGENSIHQNGKPVEKYETVEYAVAAATAISWGIACELPALLLSLDPNHHPKEILNATIARQDSLNGHPCFVVKGQLGPRNEKCTLWIRITDFSLLQIEYGDGYCLFYWGEKTEQGAAVNP